MAGGTGQKLTHATIVVAGVCSLLATIISVISIWLQTKNYRKPLLQRYVVRILLMVPIYSIASWTSMVSITLASFLDPIRDIYEAFTIYTFFQLLINYVGGERSLIIMMHGREPVHHLWPLNHVLPRVDISDPHTFLAVKRGILQYAFLKPILAVAAIIMKAFGVYQEGYIGLSSGYFWSGIIYNISVTVSLYSLGLFWVCMNKDLQAFRPMPKFLSIKLIIFASYWQGFFLSVLVWLGAIPDNVENYTPDNLAAAIQDALICVEMPIFAVAHWYAFSWQDFVDNTVQSARMQVSYAARDAFGIRDLVEDSKETLRGDKYGYRYFDSVHNIIAHEGSRSRLGRLKDGMRYERGGKGKYWIPKPGEISAGVGANVNTPLLGSNGGPSRVDAMPEYDTSTFDEPQLDDDEESLYGKARELEFGDWNYPVITENEPLHERYLSSTTAFGQSSTAAQGGRRQSKPPTFEAEVVAVKKRKRAKHPKVYKPVERSTPSHEANESVQGVGSSSSAPAPAPAPGHREPSNTPGMQEASQWGKNSEPESDGASPFVIGDEDEFQNVWGGDEQSGKPKEDA